jgi:hypothetical protein
MSQAPPNPQDVLVDYVRSLQKLGLREVELSQEALENLKKISKPKKTEQAPTKTVVARSAPVSKAIVPASAPDTLIYRPLIKLSGDKEKDIEALREVAVQCIRCPHLARTRKNVVFGVGNPNTEIMFVGEAPGADEDLQGEPFVGKAGELLTKMIEAMGLKRSDVYIANV